MGVEYKDYYKILGVERTAGDDEIRKAFRKLARQYHPDVAKNKAQAEDKFKEINEAYEVLSDPEKRKRYDALGANWKQGAEFRPPPGWEPFGPGAGGGHRGRHGRGGGVEFEFEGTGFSDFFEQIFGRKGGQGSQGGFTFDTGEVAERGPDIQADLLVTLEESLHGSVRSISLRRAVACAACHGSGQAGRRPCTACSGTGQVPRSEMHQVKIPAGVIEGQRLRVSGKGEAGPGGEKPGDLFLTIRLAGHPEFQVQGGNLFLDLDLAPWEAVLGTRVAIPTLEGQLNIKIPSGTQDGHKLRVRGRGLGKPSERGDLFVVVRIQVPAQVNETERALWESLARESTFRPRD